jgi:uncharacterized protein involved in exopolysaccharide biosynthesis/Mg-chelatase subunit ChlD/tetratricopeptide (TPR) repeat protein
MNEDSPFTIHGDEPVEARIVSWVLGEASAFEAAELERLCEERPELLVFRRRMRALHGLLTEAEAAEPDESWKLPPEKRKLLDEIFGGDEPVRLEVEKEKRIRHSGRRAFFAIAACVILTLVVLQLTPWKHKSEAIIEVRPRGTGMAPLGNSFSESNEGSLTPQFFGTEFEKIKSRRNLEKVVDNLDLTDRWGVDKEQALKIVKDSVKTQNVRGTDLIEIDVRHNNKQDADDIAREVASSYQAYRAEIERRASERQLHELNKAVRDQEDKVEERRKVLSTIARTKGVIYQGDDSFFNRSGVDEDQGAKNAMETFHKLEQEKMQLESQIGSLLKYDSDQLMTYASGLDLPDNTVKNLYPQYLEAKRQLEKEKIEGLGGRHPTVEAKTESLNELKSQLDEGVVNLRATLAAQLDLTSDRLKRVEVMKESTREEAIKRGLDVQDYVDARREFEADQQLLQTMKLKQMGETIAGKIPSESVEIHNEPVVREVAPARTALAKLANLWKDSPFTSKPAPKSKPAAPTSASARVNTANTASPSTMPVPDADVITPSTDFGEDDGFGSGWGRGTAGSEAFRKESALAVTGGEAKSAPPVSTPSRSRSAGSFGLNGAADPFAETSGEPKSLKTELSTAEGMVDVWGGSVPQDEKAREFRYATEYQPPVPAEPDAALGDLSKMTWGSTAPAAELGDNQMDLYAKDSDALGYAGQLPALGLRAGDSSVDRNRIDAILNNPDRLQQLESKESNLSLGRRGGQSGEGAESFGMQNDVSSTGSVAGNKAKAASKVPTLGDLSLGGEPFGADDIVLSNAALTDEHADNVDKLRRKLYTAEGNYNLGKFDDAKKEYQEAIRIDPYNSAARRGLERVEAAKSDYYRAAYDNTRAELLMQVDDAWELEVPAEDTGKDAANMDPFWDTSKAVASENPASGVEYEIHTGYKSEYLFRGLALGEDKAKPAPVPLVDLMEEVAASEDPYSTFSLNISDASFNVAQAALAKGEQPDPAGIKVEQFYNAVDYGDPAPSAGEPVSVTIEQAANPVIPGRNLVRVALKTAAAGRSAAQPLRLTLLVDQSGSMVREDRRAAMNKALASLGGLLTADDQVTVIGFSRTSRLLADGMAGDKAGKLADIVNQTASEGGTNLEQAINLAGQKAMSRKLAGAQNRIVLFTDGAANLGDADPDSLAEKVKALRQQGISFDIAGIAADGLNDELLGELARNGNGRYYVVGKGGDDDFAKQLAGAFRPAAENVKVQVRFNPERVGKYKLIGFEKDRLKTEDFRNDAVDAAELAAEEAGVAIYQVEPLPGGNGELGEVSVRFRDTASDQMVERSWTIQYDANAPAIDRATPSMQLALLSMLAAEKLKGGPLADAIDFKQLTESQASVKHYYQGSGRVAEMLNMVDALK